MHNSVVHTPTPEDLLCAGQGQQEPDRSSPAGGLILGEEGPSPLGGHLVPGGPQEADVQQMGMQEGWR